MDNPNEQPLQSRIANLERDMAAIKAALEKIAPDLLVSTPSVAGAIPGRPAEPPKSTVTGEPRGEQPPAVAPDASPPGASVPPPPPPRPLGPPASIRAQQRLASAPPTGKGFEIPENMKTFEFWLNKIGIGLILFGVAFAFKYSIDKGWITPPVRHLFGLAVGGVLLFLGARLYGKRRHFARVLLGGSIGTFYITGFSAFQLFALVSHTAAFAFMLGVTGLAYFIALKQDDAIFSLIGTAGALGTPFLLYTGSGSIPGLIGYTCLILAGTTAIYFFKGWRLLLWLSVVGGWVVIAIGLDAGDFIFRSNAEADQWAVQLGAVFAWLNFWAVPTVRRVLRLKNPDRWPKPLLGIGDNSVSSGGAAVLERHLHLLAVGSPLVALLISVQTWPGVEDHVFGWAAMAATVVYWLTARYLTRLPELRNLAFTHVAAGTLLFTIALCLILDGNNLLFALGAEALVLHILSRRLNDTRFAVGGHILFGILVAWMLVRLAFDPGDDPAMFNRQALTDLLVIAAGFVTAFITRRPIGLRIYLTVFALLLALVFQRELSGNLLFFVLTLEAGAYYLVAQRIRDEILDICSHVAFVFMAGYLGNRLIDLMPEGTAMFNYQALSNLSLIVTGLAIAWFNRNIIELRTYLLVSFAALAGLLWHQFDGNALLLALTIELAVLHLIAWRQSDRVVTGGAHVLVVLVGLWVFDRLMASRVADTAVFNATALTDMLTVAAALAVTFLFKTSTEKLIYRLAAHAAILIWFARELSPLENGQAYVTVAWGIYAALLLIAGLRLDYTRMRQVALATLLLIVAKLFLVDLARIATIWRVLLFVGFGGVFLALSYYFPKLWKGKTDPDTPSVP